MLSRAKSSLAKSCFAAHWTSFAKLSKNLDKLRKGQLTFIYPRFYHKILQFKFIRLGRMKLLYTIQHYALHQTSGLGTDCLQTFCCAIVNLVLNDI